MQGLADGYFVLPYTIGDYLSNEISTGEISTDIPEFEKSEKEILEKLKKLISNKGKKSVDYYHKKLGKIMWNKCGMSRNEKDLKSAIKEIKDLRNSLETSLKELRLNSNSNAKDSKLELDANIYVSLLWTTLATGIVYYTFTAL